MAKLPEQFNDSPTVAAIYAKYAAKRDTPRRYLGASIIGKACARALWYEFRWCGREEFSGRMMRLFQTGHHEEPRIVADLRSIGVEVHEVDPESKQQFPVVAVAGHVRGHMDGVCLGVIEAPKTWHLLEMKTFGAKAFAELKSKGVEAAKPEHFAQMMLYMHLADPRLERALYFAVCKDTDELYTERIPYDFNAASRLMAKAESIVRAKTPPERIADKPDAWGCKFCAHKQRCHVAAADDSTPIAPVEITCRSCIHATPVVDGGSDAGAWRCERFGVNLAESEQRRACEDHVLIPDLITAAGIADASDDPAWVEYQTIGGVTFRNGNGPTLAGDPPTFKSRELTQLTIKGVESPAVAAVKSIGAEVVDPSELPEGGTSADGMAELVAQEQGKADRERAKAEKAEAARAKRMGGGRVAGMGLACATCGAPTFGMRCAACAGEGVA